MSVKIYHNPRCSKSRQTLQLLKESGHEPDVIEYLKDVPSAVEIKDLLAALGMSPLELMRKKEAVFRDLGLGTGDKSDDVLITAMAENPILIERPIVVKGTQARIGRPPESVLEIL